MQFNSRYERYHLESSADHSLPPERRACLIKLGGHCGGPNPLKDGDDESSKRTQQSEKRSTEEAIDTYDPNQAWDVLFQTVSLLKEAGNEALKASLPALAARRYDKAINYCSVAYLSFPVGTADFLIEHQYAMSKSGGYECRWNELLKLLVMVRLNLAMVMLKAVSCIIIVYSKVDFCFWRSLI